MVKGKKTKGQTTINKAQRKNKRLSNMNATGRHTGEMSIIKTAFTRHCPLVPRHRGDISIIKTAFTRHCPLVPRRMLHMYY